jgi:uncharacterized protein (DUF433 family)
MVFWSDDRLRAHLPQDAEIPPEISIDDAVMDGLPVIRGTRVPVYLILELLESGQTISEILREYSWLTESQVRAAIRFGSLLASVR